MNTKERFWITFAVISTVLLIVNISYRVGKARGQVETLQWKARTK